MLYTEIPSERLYPPTSTPIFFGVGKFDYICTPDVGYATYRVPEFEKHKITMKEYDADHWFLLSHANELSRDLLDWIEGFAA